MLIKIMFDVSKQEERKQFQKGIGRFRDQVRTISSFETFGDKSRSVCDVIQKNHDLLGV